MVLDLHTCLKFRDDNLLVISMFITAGPAHANRKHWKQEAAGGQLLQVGQQLDTFELFTAQAQKK